MTDFLLELLSEEIPARMQVRAAADLQRLVDVAISCGHEELFERVDRGSEDPRGILSREAGDLLRELEPGAVARVGAVVDAGGAAVGVEGVDRGGHVVARLADDEREQRLEQGRGGDVRRKR